MRIGRRTMLPTLHVNWPHQVAFGENCHLEPSSHFKFATIWQPGPSITFGDGVFIGTGCEFNITHGIHVGSSCLISSGCKFIDHDHGFSTRVQPMAEQITGAKAQITLEDDVWIGANSVVLKGVTIGQGAIIAAGTVLTKSVGPFEIWGGVPGRKIRDRPSGECLDVSTPSVL